MRPQQPTFRYAALALALSAACLSAPAWSAERVNLGALASNGPVDGFIVGYRKGSASRTDAGALQRGLNNAATVFGRAKPLSLQRERSLGIGAELVRVSTALDAVEAATLMRQIATNPDVEYIEPNIRLYPVLTPNDPQFSTQYGFGTGAGGSNATTAWDSGYLGQGKIVAVVDTGITSHPDLNANVLAGGYDFISSSSTAGDGNGRDADPSDPGDYTTFLQCGFANPLPTNSSWHGTHVAGTVAAVTNNATGVAGMAHQTKILPVRVLGRCGGTLADIIDGIVWSSGGTVSGVPAVGANKANVINMSLGGSGACSAAMQSAIDGAVSRGTTVVVAAGNSNANVSGATPASCNNTVVVGATDSAGAKASFSSYGAGVDVSGPGVSILSTVNLGTKGPTTAGYASYSGTSMATPHVAGLVAMMLSKPGTDPTPAQVEALLKANVKPFGAAPAQPIGTGIIDAKKTLDATP
ncbi:MAG: S8 family peptidase [Lysobacter sp.]|nr:S8 family peptidase [Lysobacter sp.]